MSPVLSGTNQIAGSKQQWLCLVIVSAAFLGCNGDSPTPSPELAFDPNSFNRTLAWFAQLDKQQECYRENPLAYEEAKRASKEQIEQVNGKTVQWKMAVSTIDQEFFQKPILRKT